MLTRRHFTRSITAGSLAGLATPGFAGLTGLVAPTSARADTGLKTIGLQASWVNDAEFLGYFVAIQNGLYKAHNVEVNYIPGGPDVIPESSLLAGKAPLALTTPDTTIKAIATQGAKFKIIGAQFQKSPLGVISLDSKPVHTPKDLEGKILAVPPVCMVAVQGMLKVNGIAKDKVRIVPYEYDPTPLIKGEIDASIDFVTDVPYTIGLAGKKAVSFLMYDYGVTLYSDTVVVTEDFLAANRPALVNWLRASRMGWDENLKDPAKYPAAFKNSWFNGTGRATDNDVYTNTADKPLMVSPHGIFAMSEADITTNITYLKSIGIAADRSMFDTTLLAEI